MYHQWWLSGVLVCGMVLGATGQENAAGARSAALAGASVSLTDAWSGRNNPGALGGLDAWHAAIAYENQYLLGGLGHRAFAVSAPAAGGAFALAGHSFGFSQYAENRLSIAYGRMLSEVVQLGVALAYQEVRQGDIYGVRGALLGEVGMLLQPTERARLGLHLANPTRSRLERGGNERFPTALRAGVQYLFSDRVSGLAEVEKDIDRPVNIKTAVEYLPVEAFALRLGFASAQRAFSGGFGYEIKRVQVDAAAHWHQFLGFGTTLSLALRFQKPSE